VLFLYASRTARILGRPRGANDNISWTVVATDGSGNQTETVCQIPVVNSSPTEN
jgi:hypothetical protein